MGVSFSTSRTRGMTAFAMATTVLLAGCSETGEFNLKDVFKSNNVARADDEVVARATPDTTLIERDVEAPEVFEASEAALWDGRPSLGGVWVAHPDVTEPERVMIRNTANDKFVVGALFRRERDNPGPQLQASSEAADALGMLAGSPTQLEVVALRKEAVPIATPAVAAPLESETLDEAPAIETASLDPIAGAAAAIDAVEIDVPAPPAAQSVAAEELLLNEAAIITQAEAGSDNPEQALDKPFVQIGIFSGADNAERASGVLENMGMSTETRTFERDGASFWRLMVGPAKSEQERNLLLAQIKKQGYTDAYPVTD